MALSNEKAKKVWTRPVVVSTTTVAPVGLVCLSNQVACLQDDPGGNVCAPNCGECPSLDC